MTTKEKKQLIFRSLENILKAIGSFEADGKCELIDLTETFIFENKEI